MGRIMIPSTPASRGEKVAAKAQERRPLTVAELQAAAAAHGLQLVPITPESGKTGSDSGSGPEEPKGNAATEAWAKYAVEVKGAKPEDLVDAKGEPLGRDELKAKYGESGQQS